MHKSEETKRGQGESQSERSCLWWSTRRPRAEDQLQSDWTTYRADTVKVPHSALIRLNWSAECLRQGWTASRWPVSYIGSKCCLRLKGDFPNVDLSIPHIHLWNGFNLLLHSVFHLLHIQLSQQNALYTRTIRLQGIGTWRMHLECVESLALIYRLQVARQPNLVTGNNCNTPNLLQPKESYAVGWWVVACNIKATAKGNRRILFGMRWPRRNCSGKFCT